MLDQVAATTCRLVCPCHGSCAQAHILLMAELGHGFTERVSSTPGLTAWANTLQYAWQAHTRWVNARGLALANVMCLCVLVAELGHGFNERDGSHCLGVHTGQDTRQAHPSLTESAHARWLSAPAACWSTQSRGPKGCGQ